jgi:hypothetical protein
MLLYELEDYVVAVEVRGCSCATDQEELAESTGLATKSAKSTVADHFSVVVYQVCWRQLLTVCQQMFRNRWR